MVIASTVDEPTGGDADGVLFFKDWADAINDNAAITDDHTKRIVALENAPNANALAGYGPIMFAFAVGMSGEFEVYQIPALKVSST